MHLVIICVCPFVCPVRALTFENLDLEASFLVCGYILRTYVSRSSIKVMGSRSYDHNQIHVSVDGLPSTERRSHFI